MPTRDLPQTEGVKYAGSKLKLIPAILSLVEKTSAETVLDAFSGTTRVSQALAQRGYRVVANDVAVWSEVFGRCYLLNRRDRESYADLIDHLNSVPPCDGWYSEHYGGRADGPESIQADGRKKPWQLHNTRKLDGIRQEIDRLSLSQVEESVALTSLILALDRVDNTLGHFVSYLRNWSDRSFSELRLKIPRVFANPMDHVVLRRDVFDLSDVDIDLAYLDPPYGSNNEKMPPSRVRYAAYYHLWTTICLNDSPPLFGKALRRKDTSDKLAASPFEEFRRNPDTGSFVAVEAIERAIRRIRARWVILSYSSGGRATADELHRLLQQNGRLVHVVQVDYQRNVMAGMRWTNDWIRDAQSPHREFLFLLEK